MAPRATATEASSTSASTRTRTRTTKAKPKATAGNRLLVTQTRSAIGAKPKHRGTLRALGLRGVGRSNELPDRPEIRGMIARVPHMVRVESVEEVAK